jgi:hypothetical protein
MNREERYLAIMSRLESGDNPKAWGDEGFACGRYQWHPSAYQTWQPTPAEFHGKEHSWDWAFTEAKRKFFRTALEVKSDATDLEIAMAFHLHGQLRWEGWDQAYVSRWLAAVAAVDSGS